MVDKGRVMSQACYEKQTRLYKLIQESFERKETNEEEAIIALRTLGFSETVAAIRLNDWRARLSAKVPETEKERNRRLKDQTSLEKYFLRIEYMKIRSSFKQGKLSREDAVIKLIQFGYSCEFSESSVNKWESNKC